MFSQDNLDSPDTNDLAYHELYETSNRATSFLTARETESQEASTMINTHHEMTSSMIFLTTSASLRLDESKKYRSQWTWWKYLAFMIPMVWKGFVYSTQFFYGFGTIPNGYISISIYNIIAGFLGLSICSLQLWDNWFYIKPSSWVTEEEKIDRAKSCFQLYGVSIISTLLDIFLYLWVFFGNLWMLQLYGIDLLYQPAITTFVLLNVIFQGTKFSVMMFVTKYVLSFNQVRQVLMSIV